MNKSSKFILAGVVMLAVVGYLMISGFKSESVYYLEVKEVMGNYEKYNERGMRVSGGVVDGTIVKDLKNQKLQFSVEDPDGTSMPVVYNGIIPDNFKDDIEVIIEGRLDENSKVFIAETLLTKCPSKYEAEVEEG